MVFRRFIPLTAGVVIVALATVYGASAWRRHSLERRFDAALSALQRGELSAIRDTLEALEGEAEFASRRQLLQGAYLLRSGDPISAWRELHQLKPADDWRAPALEVIGECLYRLGRMAEAEQVFRLAASEQPERPKPRRCLAVIYHEFGAMEAALGELENVARLQPDDFFPHRLMGLIYFEDYGKYGEAIEHYRQALARDPPQDHRHAICRELSQSLIKHRKYSDALEILEQCPADSLVLALKANCYWSLGERNRAHHSLERALALDGNERAALLLKARIHLDEGNADAAIDSLQCAVEQDPHDVESRYQLVLAYRRLGDFEASQRELAHMEDSRQLREQLTDLYRNAMARPMDFQVREQIATVCYRLGKGELAAVWQRAAETCRQMAVAGRVEN